MDSQQYLVDLKLLNFTATVLRKDYVQTKAIHLSIKGIAYSHSHIWIIWSEIFTNSKFINLKADFISFLETVREIQSNEISLCLAF